MPKRIQMLCYHYFFLYLVMFFMQLQGKQQKQPSNKLVISLTLQGAGVYQKMDQNPASISN